MWTGSGTRRISQKISATNKPYTAMRKKQSDPKHNYRILIPVHYGMSKHETADKATKQILGSSRHRRHPSWGSGICTAVSDIAVTGNEALELMSPQFFPRIRGASRI